jgi:glycosyltransferase involved in cell wall biosynthesis
MRRGTGRTAGAAARVLSVGSLPPSWGGSAYGGVATLHATLLEGLRGFCTRIEVIGAVSPAPPRQGAPVPIFVRPAGEPTAAFYERLLDELAPDVVLMHHFAHTIGVTHARLRDAPPAIGVAHSWHNITFRSEDERRRAFAITEEALGGLDALVGMSRHCLLEGEGLGLSYPSIVETIYHPLQPFYAAGVEPDELDRQRSGVAYLGSLIPRKAPAALVEAAALIPDLRVTFAGHGQLEDELGRTIASLSLSDRVVVQHLDDREARDLLLRSEAMCLPSRSETFGLAYIEALACGVPVVGFGPTLREIRDEVGIDVGEPLDDGAPAEVAAAIERVRAAGWNRRELRARTLEAFDLNRASERYAELIASVVEGRSSRSSSLGGASTGDPLSAAICVLGMSRSGTSLTARVLNLAGVDLGPERELLGGELRQLAGEGEEVLARAREANPDGFWEHYRMMRLNERILRAFGGSWREPPDLPPGWEESERLEAERREARALLAASFGGRALWAWKDPRNSLTLPFWRRLIGGLRCVICLRNPADVAASLQRRDGIALEDGVALWLRYLAAALTNTSGRPRLLVRYESYFEDPIGAARRLACFAGCEGAFDDRGAERRLAEVVDERLWRNRASAFEANLPDFVSSEAASLFRVAELLAATEVRDECAAKLHAAVERFAEGVLNRLQSHALAREPDRQ